MPAHQRLLIIERADQRGQRFRAFQIAKRHRNVAQKAAPFGAQNRTAAKASAKLVFIERQEWDQFRRTVDEGRSASAALATCRRKT